MAATVAAYCPSRVVESKSTQPRFARRWATLYKHLLLLSGGIDGFCVGGGIFDGRVVGISRIVDHGGKRMGGRALPLGTKK